MKQAFDVKKFSLDKKIDKADISDEMANNADILGYYAYQASEWKATVDSVALQIENEEARLSLEYKAEANKLGDKITDNLIKAKVANNEEIRQLKNKLGVAQKQMAAYKVAVAAIEHKGSMLISLGAWFRSEMGSMGMHINQPSKARMTDEDKDETLSRIMKN